jgi:hypothetical protein
MSKTVSLSGPLKTHEGEVTSLTLRALTAADIVTMRKSPFEIVRKGDGEVEVTIKYDIMMAYMSRLSGVDDLLLSKMSGTDFQLACNAVGEIWNGVGE